MAVANLQSFLSTKFTTPEQIENYVKSALIYHGEIPWTYRVFKPTNVPLRTEKGGYKVVSDPPLAQPAHNLHFIRSAKEHSGTLLSSRRCLSTTASVGSRNARRRLSLEWDKSQWGQSPLSAQRYVFRLICHCLSYFMSPQIERGLQMHSTGIYIEDRKPFSKNGWMHRTSIYLKLINSLTEAQWTSIYGSLSLVEDVHEKLKEFSRPVERWTDDPNEYTVVGSDSPEDGMGDEEMEMAGGAEATAEEEAEEAE